MKNVSFADLNINYLIKYVLTDFRLKKLLLYHMQEFICIPRGGSMSVNVATEFQVRAMKST